MKAIVQSMIIGKCNFPLKAFIVPEVEGAKLMAVESGEWRSLIVG